ncbi:MAG: efflux RND transporter permease subunit, partial [Lachnospiraceae bacterium]|nr:efflux RND transporter permease subunit [Lachnospiraceae bacterium]
MSKYSVRKPYTVLVGVVLIIVLGAVSLYRMKADLLPDMNLPYVLVITAYPGGSPEEVEKNVTAPIEAQMATTSNIKNIQSMSYNNYSLVILEYEQNANMDSIVIQMQQKLDQVSGTFPKNVQNPLIMQLDPTMLPVMVASADIEGMSQVEISDYVSNTLVPYLESVEGVASVTTMGKVEETIQITLDEKKIKKINEDVLKNIDEGFSDAQKEVDDAKAKISDGEKKLQEGQEKMASELANASNEIVNGKIQAYVGESSIDSNLGTMKAVKPLLENAVKAVNDYNAQSAELQRQTAIYQEYSALLAQTEPVLTDDELIAQTGMNRAQLTVYVTQLGQALQTAAVSAAPVQAALQSMVAAGVDLNALGIDPNTGDMTKLGKQLSEALAKVNSTIAT